MEKKLRFFKQDSRWYADVPNHTLEENEMVMGADNFLDILANGKDEVFVTFMTDECDDYLIKLDRKSHDDDGAEYAVINSNISWVIPEGSEMWICNVTHDVLGEHPEYLYICNAE